MKQYGNRLTFFHAARPGGVDEIGIAISSLLLLMFLLSSPSFTLLAQCPVSQFSSPSTVCLDEQVQLINTSDNASAFEWSFCTTDFKSVPSVNKLVSNYGAVYYSKFIKKDGDVYLFFVSSTQNKLVGLLIENVETLDYHVHCEIDLSGYISNAAGFDMVNDNGTWIALIGSIVAPFKLIKIELDQDIENALEFDDLSTVATLSTPFDIRILRSGSNYFAFIANNTATITQQLIRLSFGSSLSNAPAASYIGFPTSAQTASMDFHHSCDAWTAFVSSRNGKLFRADFGSDLAAVPVITELTLSSVLNDPAGLALIPEHDEFFLLIQSRNGNTYTGTVSSMVDNTVDIVDFGNIKSANRDWDVEVLRSDGAYKVVSGNFTNGGAGGLYTLNFQTQCPANIRSSINASEIISFQETGTFKISLKTFNETGNSHSLTREVTVSNLHAANLDLLHAPVYCASVPVEFTVSSDSVLTDQTWDFGDGGAQSTDPSPVYTFANSGKFIVTVNVTSSNGCNNFQQSEIAIYDQPIPSFSLPPNPICTNNLFTFLTTTPDIYNGNLSYQWFVDNTLVSADRDLQYTFTTTGPKDVKLITSIPGCSSEITKTTSPIAAGPVVDFSFTGSCEDDTFSFQNQTTDPVTGYQWDFGNGETSAIANPNHIFTTYGNYSVSLTATNSAGCQNVKRETIIVHSNPQTDFSAAAPPNACSGIATQFNDESSSPDGAEITAWLWDFHDASNPTPDNAKDATHTFATPGVYNVSLTAITAAGCAATTGEAISISPSPSTAFIFSPACVGLPVSFASPQDNSIISRYWEIGNAYYNSSTPTHTFASYGDYPLYLEVTSENGCISRVNKVIHVPAPLSPDFSALKNCVGQEAVLADVTSGTDAVVSRQWAFDTGETFSGSQVMHTFQEQGDRTITLSVTAESGCVYEATKDIEIVPPPTARFSADPATGAYPLEVRFVNTSSASTEYLWKFNDGSGATSTEASPFHTFNGIGSFAVELTAFNEQECEASFTAPVTTEEPLPDADIEQINFSQNEDGSLKLIVTLHNKGNTVLRNLPLELDFNGQLTLRQVLQEPIQPSSNFNYVFSTGIVDAYAVGYLCVSALVEKDVTPAGNRACQQLGNRFVVVDAFPNPTTGLLHLEWIEMGDQTVRVLLTDVLGRTLLALNVPGSDGLNRRTIDLSGLQNGIYNVLIEGQGVKKIQRITVSGKP